MQLIRPKVDQVQRKYKNDQDGRTLLSLHRCFPPICTKKKKIRPESWQETQNRMLLRLYDDCGVNPLGGWQPRAFFTSLLLLAFDHLMELQVCALPGSVPHLHWTLSLHFEALTDQPQISGAGNKKSQSDLIPKPNKGKIIWISNHPKEVNIWWKKPFKISSQPKEFTVIFGFGWLGFTGIKQLQEPFLWIPSLAGPTQGTASLDSGVTCGKWVGCSFLRESQKL